MSIEVYNAALTNRHEITHAISIQMAFYYNEIGKATFVLPIDDYNVAACEIDGVIYDTDRDISYTIQAIKYDTTNNRMTLNGYTCNWLLNKRCVPTHTSITNVETSVYSAVTANLRGLTPIVNAASKGLTETAESGTEWYGGQLLDNIIEVLDEVELGHRMKWDADYNRHVFEIYKGTDKTTGVTAAVFSQERGSAENLKISTDYSTYKNCVYVPAKMRDDSEITETYGNTASGNSRYEYWLNSTTSQKSDETESALRLRLQGSGAAQAARRPLRQSFTVDIDPDDYRTAYNMGDIVTCVSVQFGVQFNARITGVKYKLDVTGTTTSLILGEPTLTTMGELILNG